MAGYSAGFRTIEPPGAHDGAEGTVVAHFGDHTLAADVVDERYKQNSGSWVLAKEPVTFLDSVWLAT
jgi:hypothetical protein